MESKQLTSKQQRLTKNKQLIEKQQHLTESKQLTSRQQRVTKSKQLIEKKTTSNEGTATSQETTASIRETKTSNQYTATTENSSNEFTETYKDEKNHTIVPEITTTRITSSDDNIKFECLERFGLYPDPESCTKFYHCSHWIGYPKTCPSNLHFNPVLQVCDWPYRAGCVSGTTVSTAVTEQKVSTPSQQTTSDDGNDVTSCSCDSCELPLPDSCNSYILCIDQSGTLISCGNGLNFNVMTGTCDWEDNVVCETNVQCPKPMGRFPYPRSCYHFMECDSGEMTVNRCPEGMVYSKSNEKCSWSEACEDNYTSIGTTYSPKYDNTTILETSSHVPKPTETASKISTKDTITTPRSDTSSKANGLSSTKTISTSIISEISTKSTYDPSKLSSTFHPGATSTKFDTTFEDSTPSKNLSTDQTIITDEDEVTTTLLPLTSPITEATTKSDKTSTEGSNITDKFTVIPTTVSVPSESITTSSSYDISSTPIRVSESPSTTTNLPDYSTKTPTSINPATETTIPTETHPDASTFADAISFETASSTTNATTSNLENVTIASTKRLTDSTTSNLDNVTDASTKALADSTTADLENVTETSTKALADSTTANLENVTDASTKTLGNSTTANFEDVTDAPSKELIDSSTTKDVTSTKGLVTMVPPSSEIPKIPSTEDHSEITELTVSISSNMTEDIKTTVSLHGSSITPSTTEKSVNASFVCPSRFGLFPDSDSCFHFYHCSHWVDHHKKCPSGLHFNPKLQVCDWPYRAGCGGSPVVSTSETIQPKEDDIIFNQTCDCECCFYANKTDCSKYTLCLDGVLHRGQCAEGLLFNHLDTNCDIADRVTCLQTSASCPTPNGVFPHPVLCSAFYRCFNGQPTLERCPDDKHFKASEGKCVDPCHANCNKTLSCYTTSPPSEVSTSPICIENDGLYPAENDCSSYYQCAEGHAYFVKCPNGLHFNVEYGVCEPPCDAGCDPTIDCPSPIRFANSKSLVSLAPKCPRPNGLFPAAQDCSAYYLCSKGNSYLQHCPPGLHYSKKDETCETPCNAQCEKNFDCSASKGGRSKEKLLTLSSPLPLRLICKTLSNGTIPNPKNCTSFYKCLDGKPHLLPCPRGLHFDPEDRECKNPCLAGCESSIKCPSEIPVHKGKCSCENCYLQDPTDCSAYLFCSRGLLTKGYCPRGNLFDRSSSECRKSSEVVCEAVGDPDMCSKQSGNFPYPGNCHRFVRCEDSVAHIVDCADGLEFDPEIRACANPKGYCDRIVKDPLCDDAIGQFAHPRNSSLFYQCENGVKYLKSCSLPLIYNALEQVCDWPHNTQDKSTKEVLKTQDIKNEISTNISALSSGHQREQLCHEVPGVTCPCACRVTTYDDCDSFYHCRGDGKACRRRCPRGLYFNRQTMVCDLPRNVECRDFFFATLKRLKYQDAKKTWLKYPLQAVLS